MGLHAEEKWVLNQPVPKSAANKQGKSFNFCMDATNYLKGQAHFAHYFCLA